jgi:hypothetical protein
MVFDMETMENQSKMNEILLIGLLKDYKMLLDKEKKRKKLQSSRNKRFYQNHRIEILKKNKEMREIYKLVKRN